MNKITYITSFELSEHLIITHYEFCILFHFMMDEVGTPEELVDSLRSISFDDDRNPEEYYTIPLQLVFLFASKNPTLIIDDIDHNCKNKIYGSQLIESSNISMSEVFEIFTEILDEYGIYIHDFTTTEIEGEVSYGSVHIPLGYALELSTKIPDEILDVLLDQ